MKTKFLAIMLSCSWLLGGAAATDPQAGNRSAIAGIDVIDAQSEQEFYAHFQALRKLGDEAELQSNQQALITGSEALRNRNVPPGLADQITNRLNEVRGWARSKAKALADKKVTEIDISKYKLTDDQRRTLEELQPAFQDFNYTLYYYRSLILHFNRVGERLQAEYNQATDPKMKRARQLELLKFVYDFRSFWADEYANYRGFGKFEILSKYKREALQASDEFDELQSQKRAELEAQLSAATSETLKKIIQASIDARIKLGETVAGSVDVWRDIDKTVAKQQKWIDDHLSKERQMANKIILDLTADTYKALVISGDRKANVVYEFFPEELGDPVDLTWDLELFRKVVKLDRMLLK